VIIWVRANSVCMIFSVTGMLLILPESDTQKGFVSARNQSTHR